MKHAEPKKQITKQRKQIYIIIAVITIILLIITGVLGVKIAKNGLSLKGMLMTSIGQDEKDIQNLEPFYCLVMGVSEDIEAKLTDTIMLCAYYPNEQQVSMLSIPRDTFVGNSRTRADSYDKINALYQKSPEKTLEAVRNLTGIDVRNYVVISNNALRDVVDAIDGVYFDVPINMNYDDAGQKLHIHLKKGYQLLDGDKAEQLVRFRHNNDKTTYPEEYGTEDIGRMRTQREFLKAAAKQILSGDNLLKIDDIMKVVFENVETNVKMEDIIKYIPSATEFNPENIKSEMLPGKPDFIAPLSFYLSDEEETNKVVSNLFGISEEQINLNREKFEKDLQDKINMSKDLLNNFDFEIIKKMTIMNSHGDYSVQQLIYNDNSKTTVIDFETAKKLPIIWEVLRSYSYIDEEAKNGELNIDTLVEYVKEFAKYVQLNEYDLKYAAQLYLIQIVSSPFGYKQYNDDYEKKGLLEFALFRTNLCRYLYNNSKEISTRLQKEVNGYTKV